MLLDGWMDVVLKFCINQSFIVMHRDWIGLLCIEIYFRKRVQTEEESKIHDD